MAVDNRQGFWTTYQPGFRFTDAPVGSAQFFAEIEAHRYALEPAIEEQARFDRWGGADVLECGCGMATDGARFARAGARYTGVDFSPAALALAKRRFAAERLPGSFVSGSIAALPFEDESFDLVYSCGVVHHLPDTERAVAEFHRVLRPGGTALAMVYHRRSLNYHVSIMGVRRALVPLLLIPGMSALAARLTGEGRELLDAHRELLRKHGRRYLTDRHLFLSNNTDGPGNPLSKVYTRREADALFERFATVTTAVRFLNLRAYPGGGRLARTALARRVERRYGWHLWIRALR